MSQVVWQLDKRTQKYPEHRVENHPKYPELVQMEKCPKHPERPEHPDRVRMENHPKRGFP
jgi:hypothetical protein